jgi:hypothetical protein
MAYISVIGFCFLCRALFQFNPLHVPSYFARGERQPICMACMEALNRERQARGLDAFDIHPDAYKGEPEENVPNDR